MPAEKQLNRDQVITQVVAELEGPTPLVQLQTGRSVM